jgi:MFS family permease
MLRIWRIIGIVVFALLVGMAASSLRGGEDALLFEADLAIFVVSLPAFAVLGLFELTHVRRLERRRRKHRFEGHSFDEGAVAFAPGSTDIYAMPETRQNWGSRRRSSSSGTRHRKGKKKLKSVWMSALQLFCVVLPLVYLGLLLVYLPWDGVKAPGAWTMSFVFLSLFLFSVVAAIGVFSMRLWGLVLGYLLVIWNLLLFPYGLILGLLLLLCLVGSSPTFFEVARDHRRGR